MTQLTTRGSITNPGASSRVTLFDDVEESDVVSGADARVRVMALLDQNFTINVWWAEDKAATTPLYLRSSTTYTGGSGGHVTPVTAKKPITVVAVASLVNNDYFTVILTITRDGVVESTTTKIFEYQVDGTFTATAGRTTIDVSAVATDVEVAVLTASTIVATFGGALTAATPVTATLTLASAVSGPAYVISGTENVANGGFSLGAAVVGVDGTIVSHNTIREPGRNKIVLDTGTAPVEFAVRVGTYNSYEPGV